MTQIVHTSDFVNITEFGGQRTSEEQLKRACHRYHWAAQHCVNKDVIELACGCGSGLGLVARAARSVRGGDISPEVLERALRTYGNTVPLDVFPADTIPARNESVDVLLLFEALYYLPDAEKFLCEAARVLRPSGKLLIVTANRDLFDFTPSPHSTRYFGVHELANLLQSAGFESKFWGYLDVRRLSLRQRLFRPLKFVASYFGLVPKTMNGKSFLKKIVFGSMTVMPARLDDVPFKLTELTPLDGDRPDRHHKVIYCAATKVAQTGLASSEAVNREQHVRA